MKKFNKRGRLKIYKLMLANIRDIKTVGGLCLLLFDILIDLYKMDKNEVHTFAVRNMGKNFPELYKLKPKKVHGFGYWFKPYSVELRKKLMQKVISEMECSKK